MVDMLTSDNMVLTQSCYATEQKCACTENKRKIRRMPIILFHFISISTHSLNDAIITFREVMHVGVSQFKYISK